MGWTYTKKRRGVLSETTSKKTPRWKTTLRKAEAEKVETGKGQYGENWSSGGGCL